MEITTNEAVEDVAIRLITDFEHPVGRQAQDT